MSNLSRPPLEVADVFRLSGNQYKATHRGHLSLAQLKVMSAIEGIVNLSNLDDKNEF
jgi:hypothetical protein